MLQEICRNIGNDISTDKPTTKPPSPRSRKTAKLHSPNSDGHTKPSSASDSSKPYSLKAPAKAVRASQMSPPRPAVSCDMDRQVAAHYHSFYQGILDDQKRPNQPPADMSQIFNSSLIYNNMGQLPTSLRPPVATGQINPTEFAKLAAFFYSRLQENNSVFRNNMYPMMPPEKGSFLDNPAASFLPPSPLLSPPAAAAEPKLHKCQWVTANGFCGKNFFTNEELMVHLQTHVLTNSCNDNSASSLLPNGAGIERTSPDSLAKFLVPQQPTLRFQPYSLHHRPLTQLFH